MAALNKTTSQMADASGDPLIGARQSNVADAAVTLAALTAGPPLALTLTWSTGDPGGTPDGTITIADGAVVAAAELAEFWEAMEAHHTLGNALAVELIADHAVTITDLGVMSTKINAILDVLEEHGLMTAS